MLDTARHFISKKAIFRTLDAMMFNKFNVFHWHITDDESFPLELKSYPEITKTGRFKEGLVYSEADVKEIVNRATSNGIRVIAEVDSPGHVRSWGLSPSLSNITIHTPGGKL
jgi:hexosaminidase